MLRLLPGIFFLFGLFSNIAQAGGELPAAEVARLSNVVRQDCGSCHGLTLKGGLGRPLTAEHLASMDRETVRDIILFGIDETPMPGWLGLLSEPEADWIAGALKTGAIR
ncbi:MAG TPA: cytochrome c [Afifellaceae bacterium]|nr:cytochrome c [Afifellaceae bacterium]